MLTRLLLDPETPTEGVNVDTPKPAEVRVETKPDPSKVTLNKADLDAMKSELNGFKQAKAEQEDKARLDEEAKAIERGEQNKIIKDREDKIAARDRALADEKQARITSEKAAGRAIARAELLAALPSGVIEGKSGQLVKLMLDDIEATLEGDDFKVVAKDGRTVAEFVKAEIDKNYQHFLVATSRGGVGADASKTTKTDQGDKPKNLGEQMVDVLRQRAPAGGGVAFGSKYADN